VDFFYNGGAFDLEFGGSDEKVVVYRGFVVDERYINRE
jgi:hypothetical protein